MILFRRIKATDYGDILDICKDIWDGADYLPELFYQWAEDNGFFMAAVDEDSCKVIGVGKYSIFPDGTGWLEGLRVHEAYRGLKISNRITDLLLDKAKQDLIEKKIIRIAYSTHATSSKSIHLMEERGFKLKQKYITVYKSFEELDSNQIIDDFDIKPWEVSYEEFKELNYIKRRNNLLPIAFVFQRPTIELYNSLVKGESFVLINGKKGIFKYKGEPNFIVIDESFDSIDTFANYYGHKHKGIIQFPPLTTIMEADKELIDSLKANNYTVWSDWEPDYLYFEYEV